MSPTTDLAAAEALVSDLILHKEICNAVTKTYVIPSCVIHTLHTSLEHLALSVTVTSRQFPLTPLMSPKNPQGLID